MCAAEECCGAEAVGGRGHGEQRHGNANGNGCCGQGGKMHGYMETCLLVLLQGNEDHGYALAEQLGNFGFDDVNASTLYRVMRRMEGFGWVRSKWAQGGKGPQRRVYAITDVGASALGEQIEAFVQRRTCIDTLLGVYEGKG